MNRATNSKGWSAELFNLISPKGLKQLLAYSSGNFGAQLVMMLYAVLVARFLEPENLGVYSGVYAILGVSITLVNLGMDNWFLKEGSRGGDRSLKFFSVVSNKIFLGILWTLLCLLFIPLLKPEAFRIAFILFACIDLLCDSLLNSIIALLTIDKAVRKTNTLILASRSGKLVLLLGLIFLQGKAVVWVALTRMLVALIVCGLGFLELQKQEDFHWRLPRLNLSILKDARHFALSDILAVIYGNLDLAILSVYSLVQAGYYSPATGIIHALFVIPSSFYYYFLPTVTKGLDLGTWKQKPDSVKLILLFSVLGVVLSLGTLVFAYTLFLPILGADYQLSRPLLGLLSPILIFKSISMGFAVLIVAQALQQKRLLPQFLIALLDIILVFALVPGFGARGVAWAYLASELLLMLAYAVIAIKYADNNPQVVDRS